MVTNVVIAAAGQGTRMLHLSKDKPKHLIEVNGRPFLAYVLDNLFLAGYRDVILVVGYKKELMDDFKSNYTAPGKEKFEISFVNQFEILGPKEKIYGTACPLMCVKDINEQFLYICGDNFYSIEDLRGINIDNDYNYVAGAVSDHPENFGVLVEEGEFLKEIKEKYIPIIKYISNRIRQII